MRNALLLCGAILVASAYVMPAYSEEKAQGFIVTSESAKIYKRSKADAKKGDEFIHTLKRGEGVVGLTTGAFGEHLKGASSNGWTAEEVDGRIHVEFLEPSPRAGKFMESSGWMDRADVASFRYECGCGPKEGSDKDPCSPFIIKGFLHDASWNPCFQEGLEKKTETLAAPSAGQPSVQQKASPEDRLKKLEEMLKKNLITKEEYDAKRAEILKEM